MTMNVKPLKIEIEKRRVANEGFIKAEEVIKLAIEEYTQLNNDFKGELAISRSKLEGIYKELRHYSGNWVVVYNDTQIDKYPYYNGETDDKCNPYFRMTAVQAGDSGIEPIDAPVTRTTPAIYNRQRTHTTEDVFRSSALTALNAYPDRSNEVLTTTTTIDPIWSPEDTAVGLLKATLNPWKFDIETIVTDIYDNAVAVDFWQNILDEINNCLSLLPLEAVYPNQTSNPTGALLVSLNLLKSHADTSTTAFVDDRKLALEALTTNQEELFFGIIKLRLHFVNGSYSKLKVALNQQANNSSLIKDNKEAIISLTNIIISQ